LLVLVGFSEKLAHACTCIQSNEAIERYSFRQFLIDLDGAMFTGRVAKIERVQVKLDDEFSVPQLKVTFEVERFWKGVEGAEVVIYTGVNGAACGVHYSMGKKYFVIAYNRQSRLETNICSSPRRYSDLKDYIRELGEGSKPN